MKKILSALILTILAIGSIAILSAPCLKAQTTQCTILSYSSYVAPSTTELAQYAGDLIVVGEVENTGTIALSTVSVEGIAYNSTTESSNATVDSAYATLIGVPELLPGQKAPFYMEFLPTSSPISSLSEGGWTAQLIASVTNITLTIGAEVTTSQTMYSDLTATGVHNYVAGGTYVVSGSVDNSGTQTIGQVWVLVTYYNAAGTVVAMNCTDYLDPSGSSYLLLPGNAVPFTATPADNTASMTSQITAYSLLIETETTISPTTSPTPSPSPTSTPMVTSTAKPNATPAPSSAPIPTPSQTPTPSPTPPSYSNPTPTPPFLTVTSASSPLDKTSVANNYFEAQVRILAEMVAATLVVGWVTALAVFVSRMDRKKIT